MNLLLEVVVVPVSDVDRAKDFYAEKVGFHVDHDSTFPRMRVVQLTPQGSACSIVIGSGLTDMPPGSMKGLQLVVADIRAAREHLVRQGVGMTEVRVAGPEGFRASQDDDELDNVGFAFFSDPDGNGWSIQQISSR